MSVAKCFDIVSNVHIICKISNCFKILKKFWGGGGLGGGVTKETIPVLIKHSFLYQSNMQSVDFLFIITLCQLICLIHHEFWFDNLEIYNLNVD